MRTAIYIRVSTQEQAQEGFSLAAQAQKLRAYCESQDWNVIDIYADEGFSAKDTERPNLKRMMKDVQNMKLDVVLVYRLDRLTRPVLDLYELLRIFDKYDVGFKSATEVFDTTTAIGRLFITIVAAMAQWERENIGERVSIGMAQKALEGKRVTAVAPFGYIKQGDTLIINDGEADVVKEMFHKYISGYGIHRINLWLRSTNIRDGVWNQHTISYILENPVYIGKIRWGYRTTKNHQNVIITDGNHESIIDQLTWELAQEVRSRRSQLHPRSGTGRFPFTGILYCAKCGTSMMGYYGPKYLYYRCRNYILKTCNARMIRCDTLETSIIGYLDELSQESLNNTVPKTQKEPAAPRKQNIEKELGELKQRKKRLWDAYEHGSITIDNLDERLERIRSEETKLQSHNTESDEEAISLEMKRQKVSLMAQQLKTGWQSFSNLQRKEFLRSLIERIDADHENIMITLKSM